MIKKFSDIRRKFNEKARDTGNYLVSGLGDKLTKEVEFKSGIFKPLIPFVACATLSYGCSSLGESRFLPKDYQGRVVGEHMVDSWSETGKEYSSGRIHRAIPNTIGSVLTTANDLVEFPVRGLTNSLAQLSRDIPVAREITGGLDYIMNSFVFDSAVPGGQDWNDSYGRLLFTFPGLGEGEWYDKSIPGFFTNSYQGVKGRIDYERGSSDESVSATGQLRIGAEGTVKTVAKFPWIFLFLRGGGGSGSSAPQGTNPGPAPF